MLPFNVRKNKSSLTLLGIIHFFVIKIFKAGTSELLVFLGQMYQVFLHDMVIVYFQKEKKAFRYIVFLS